MAAVRVFLLLLAIATPATALAGESALEKVVDVDIAAQALGDALIALSRQSGTQILTAAEEVKGLTAKAVRGRMSVGDALADLLEGTGLEARSSGANTIGIAPRRSGLDDLLEHGRSPSGEPGAMRPPAPVPEAPRARVIEEIVVTAQKQEQRLRDVPISVTVLDSQFLAEQSINDFTAVANYTANFRVNNLSGSVPPPDLRIRGFGTARANRAFEQAVGLALDGDSFGQQEFFRAALFDIDRVEVLKGPQGTLFGKNTTAGLVNLVPKGPTAETTGYLDLKVGDFGRREIQGAVGGPLIADLLNFRVAAVSDERDGYLENTTASTAPGIPSRAGGFENRAIRAKLGVPHLAGVSLDLTGEHSEALSSALPVEILDAEPQAMRDLLVKYDPNVDLKPGNYVGSFDLPRNQRGRRVIDRFAANAGYEWAGWELSALVGHARLTSLQLADIANDPIPSFIAVLDDGMRQTSFELRTSSPLLRGFFGLPQLAGFGLGASELTGGLFHQRRHYTTHTQVSLNAAALGETFAADAGIPPVPGNAEANREPEAFNSTFSDFSQDTNSYAGFAHLRWLPFGRWTLENGLRLTYETKDGRIVRTFDSPQSELILSQVASVQPLDVGLDRSELAFTPRVAVIYDVTDEINAFASWAIGFKSGGFNENGTVSNGLRFGPERMEAWELGSRARLLGGAATADFTLFWMNASDLQLYTLAPPEGVGLFGQATTVNVGEARSRGFEGELAWLPTSWLTLRDSLGLVDSEYLDFPIGSCEPGSENRDGDDEPRCDLAGEPFEFTPKWVNTLTASVRFPLERFAGLGLPAAGAEAFGSLTLRYEDVHFANDTATPFTRQEAFLKLDASAGFGDPASGWSVSVTGQNLTDEVTYVTRARWIVGGLGTGVPAPPRMIFGGIRYVF